jgi:hypothetical protein
MRRKMKGRRTKATEVKRRQLPRKAANAMMQTLTLTQTQH